MTVSPLRQLEEPKLRGIGRFYVILSRCFLLPLYINKDMTVLRFNLFSLRTFLSFALCSIPLIFAVIWNVVLREGFLLDYISAVFKVYIKFDCYFLLFYTGSQMTPLLTQFSLWIACTAYAALPEITASKKLIFPYDKKNIIITLILKVSATFLVSLGNFLLVSPQLTKYSIIERFINIFSLVFVPWVSNNLFIFLMMLLLYTMIDNLCEQMSDIPESGIEKWSWKKVELMKKFQTFMNGPTLLMISVGQILWVLTLFFALGLPLGAQGLELPYLLISVFGYLLYCVVYLFLLKLFIFKVDNLNRLVKSLRLILERMEADGEKTRKLILELDSLEPVSGYGLFSLDRTTLTSMVSVSLTYVIILLQFKQNIVNN